MTFRPLLTLICCLSALLQVGAVEAESCVVPKEIYKVRADSVGILHGPGIDRELVERAIELWQSCPNYGVDMPHLLNGERGDRTISVEYRDESSNARHCGFILENRIVLYRSAVSRRGRPMGCGSVFQNLAHELGHVLGLDDSGRRLQCSKYIMAPIDPFNGSIRAPRPSECAAAGLRWVTVSEIPWTSDVLAVGGL